MYFYAKSGWLPLPQTTTLVGPPEAPVAAEGLLLMLFLSERGQRAEASFRRGPVYFAADTTW